MTFYRSLIHGLRQSYRKDVQRIREQMNSNRPAAPTANPDQASFESYAFRPIGRIQTTFKYVERERRVLTFEIYSFTVGEVILSICGSWYKEGRGDPRKSSSTTIKNVVLKHSECLRFWVSQILSSQILIYLDFGFPRFCVSMISSIRLSPTVHHVGLVCYKVMFANNQYQERDAPPGHSRSWSARYSSTRRRMVPKEGHEYGGRPRRPPRFLARLASVRVRPQRGRIQGGITIHFFWPENWPQFWPEYQIENVISYVQTAPVAIYIVDSK